VHDRTAIAVAHTETSAAGPTVVVDRVVRFVPTKRRRVDLAEVEETVWSLSRSYNRAQVQCDPFQAVLMCQNLRRRGVRIDEVAFSQTFIGRLALNLYRQLRDRTIALPDDELLLDELASVQLREVGPNTFRLDHAAGGHDDQAIAVALAALELARASQPGRVWFLPPSGRQVRKPSPAARSVRRSPTPLGYDWSCPVPLQR
jgi:hypothetical protein